MLTSEVDVVLVVDVAVRGICSWSDGPLPLTGRGPSGPVTADGPTRSTLFHPRVSRILYGEGNRFHRVLSRPEPLHVGGSPTELRVVALELLVAQDIDPFGSQGDPTRVGELMIHVRVRSTDANEALRLLHEAVRPRNARTALHRRLNDRALIGDTTTCAIHQPTGLLGERQPYCVSFVPLEVDGNCSPERLWEWAAATPNACRALSERDSTEASAWRIQLSADWNALVLRDGAAFQMTTATTFTESARLYALSVYTDALALGRLQAGLIDALAEATAANSHSDVRAVADIVRCDSLITWFRAEYWWKRISPTGPVNELLRDLQRQLDLQSELENLQVEARGIRENMEVQIAQKSQRANEITNSALALLTMAGLPLGAALAIWAEVSSTWPGLAVATASAMIASLGLSRIPGLRGLAATLRSTVDPTEFDSPPHPVRGRQRTSIPQSDPET